MPRWLVTPLQTVVTLLGSMAVVMPGGESRDGAPADAAVATERT